MSDGPFRPIGDSDECMFGPRAVIATGFDPDEHASLMRVVEAAGLGDASVCFATHDEADQPLGALASRIMTTGLGKVSGLERAVVLSGASEAELHRMMNGYRAAGLPRPLWATLTEHSAEWPLGELLAELGAERAAIEGPPGSG